MLSNYSQIHLIASYSDGAALLKGLQNSLPDVLLLDIQMPGKTGDELVPVLLKKYPDLRILTFTNFESMLYAHSMLRLGVKGYILKSSSPDLVLEAIHKIHNGEDFFDPAIKDKLTEFSTKAKKEAFIKPQLTTREKEILQLLVDGNSSHEISETLFIGIRTIDFYRSNILLKMDCKNTAELTKKALLLGMVK